MPLPKLGQVSEEEALEVKRKKELAEIACSSCEQKIQRVRVGDRIVMPAHNRKVFRRYKNGKPDWVFEACPGGNV